MELLMKNMDKIEAILRPYRLTDDTYRQVMYRMNHSMDLGLSANSNIMADLKMYVTYVRSVPDGSEYGNFLALDLGGTNFRVLLINLSGGKATLQSTVYMVPESVMHGPGDGLFNLIAESIHSFLVEQGLEEQELPLGFTFSFPCKQEGLAKSKLVTWTKGFKCSNVEGEDIVQLLDSAIARKGLKVRCMAVINDTVGALVACAHEDRNCEIGIILGTGTNACYIEDIRRVELWDGDKECPRQVIINTEWGAFGNNGALDFITTEEDRAVDGQSINQGKQIYEKMISGMYMGELVRQLIVKLVESKCLFNGVLSEKLGTPMQFFTKYISEIETDGGFDGFVKTRQVLEDLRITRYTLVDCLILQEVCKVVSTRAAHLAAAGTATLLQRVDKPQVTVAVDGSLYRYHPHFHDLMCDRIKTLVPHRQFKLMLSNDGSGKGAGLVAAVSSRLSAKA